MQMYHILFVAIFVVCITSWFGNTQAAPANQLFCMLPGQLMAQITSLLAHKFWCAALLGRMGWFSSRLGEIMTLQSTPTLPSNLELEASADAHRYQAVRQAQNIC